MENWRERPVYIAVPAFLAGAAVTAIIMFLILGGDGDDDPSVTAPTSTPFNTAVPLANQPVTGIQTSTPGTAPAAGATLPPEGTPEATATEPDDPDEALAAFVLDEFGQEFIGECPLDVQPEEVVEGMCGLLLYESDNLVTYSLGPPSSEGIGEAVVTLQNDGSWSVTFVSAPPLGGEGPSVGNEAIVFGAGSCLNFRNEPSAGAETRTCAVDSTHGLVIDGPVEADGVVWWHLEGLGWASEEFLVPAS